MPIISELVIHSLLQAYSPPCSLLHIVWIYGILVLTPTMFGNIVHWTNKRHSGIIICFAEKEQDLSWFYFEFVLNKNRVGLDTIDSSVLFIQ